MRPFVLVCTTLLCCAPPERVRILDGTGDAFELVDVPRGGLADLDRVVGRHARFLVDTELDVTAALSGHALDRGRASDLLFGEPHAPNTRWTAVDGTAVPDDFDTLALFTAYAHTERAMGWFEDAGAVSAAVDRLDVHYLPHVVNGDEGGMATTDNAYYFLPGDAVLLLPPDRLQDIPLAMNAGVVAHELSHRVAYWQLWDAARFAIVDEHEASFHTEPHRLESLYLLMALDEGMADYFGAVVSGDPAFVGRSVGELLDERDVSVVREYEAWWLGNLDAYFDGAFYDPYRVGAVLASALWATGERLGHDRVSAAVLAAQQELAPRVRELAVLHTEVEVEILRQLDADPEACASFALAYAQVWDTFSEVCP